MLILLWSPHPTQIIPSTWYSATFVFMYNSSPLRYPCIYQFWLSNAVQFFPMCCKFSGVFTMFLMPQRMTFCYKSIISFLIKKTSCKVIHNIISIKYDPKGRPWNGNPAPLTHVNLKPPFRLFPKVQVESLPTSYLRNELRDGYRMHSARNRYKHI